MPISTEKNPTAAPKQPDAIRAIWVTRFDYSAAEDIARIIDCPIGTVRSRIFRAREAIAERLRPLLDTHKDQRW